MTTAVNSAGILEWLASPAPGCNESRESMLFDEVPLSDREREVLRLAEQRGYLVDLYPPDQERHRVNVVDAGNLLVRMTVSPTTDDDEAVEWDGWRPQVEAPLLADDLYDEVRRAAALGQPSTWIAWAAYRFNFPSPGRPAVMVGPQGPTTPTAWSASWWSSGDRGRTGQCGASAPPASW
jgi:hypothetical protein